MDDNVKTDEDTPVTINVLSNDNYVNTLSAVVSITAPNHGTAKINANDTITYKPDKDYFGTDSFSYIVRNSAGDTDTATVMVTIKSVKDHSSSPYLVPYLYPGYGVGRIFNFWPGDVSFLSSLYNYDYYNYNYIFDYSNYSDNVLSGYGSRDLFYDYNYFKNFDYYSLFNSQLPMFWYLPYNSFLNNIN